MLIFDGDTPFPDDTCSIERTIGGGLTGAKRCEYMALCQQLTSRDKDLDYQPILDRMFAILKEDVLEHIGTLADKKTLVADIGIIFDGIPKDASGKYVIVDYLDYLRIYNIVSFQIACLFTDYYKDVKDTTFDSMAGHFNILLTIDYKNYSTIKTALLSNDNTDVFIKFIHPDLEPKYKGLKSNNNESESNSKGLESNNNESESNSKGLESNSKRSYDQGILYFIQLGSVTISGIVEYIFNHILVTSLIYELENLHDFGNTKPIGMIVHNMGHYDMDAKWNYTYIDTILKGFLPYIKGLNLDKEHKYAVYFILFTMIHEGELWDRCPKEGITKDFLTKNLNKEESCFEYLNINDHGMAIPSKYRELEEGSDTEIKLENVQEFFTFAIATFMEHYTAFRATKGGRRRKTNKRKRKTGRKRKTHRRSK